MLPIEDLETLKDTVPPSGARSSTIDQLLRSTPQIDIIREYCIYHYNDYSELKEIKRYFLDMSRVNEDNLFTPANFSRLFGKRAKEVFNLLKEYGYGEALNNNIRLKTKMLVTALEDFHIGRPRAFEEVVYQGLNSLLRRRIQTGKDKKGEWLSKEAYLLYDNEASLIPPVGRTSNDYLFRIGNRFLIIDFYHIPSQELLELIQLKLALIYQEQMENFFNIVASFSIERATWEKSNSRQEIFRQVLESFFGDSWALFDLSYLSLQIQGGDGDYSFAHGSSDCAFNHKGQMTWTFDEKNHQLPQVEDSSKEFLTKNIQLLYSQYTGEPVVMNIYLKSRSVNNIDPKKSVLLHSFITLLGGAITRVIEVVIPIQQMEKTKRALKRHLFMETIRVRNNLYGEDLSKIINNSLSVIKSMFKIHHAYLYTESHDFLMMLDMFQRINRRDLRNYQTLQEPFSAEDMRKYKLIGVRILEQIGEKVIFYFQIPNLPGKYGNFLENTEAEVLLKQVFKQFKLPWLEEGLEGLSEIYLPSNMGSATNEIISYFSSKPKWLGSVSATQLADRIVKDFSLFFELVNTLDYNLESGVTTVRGSRDRLTGLYNRQAFSQKLNHNFEQGRLFGLMFIDMDTFKIYNDAVSHSFGDKLLIALANQMFTEKIDLDKPSIAGRFGGDEFSFSIMDVTEEEFQHYAYQLFRSITLKELQTRLYLEDRPEQGDFDINFISFLHRLLRPDVGGTRGAGSDYVEEKGISPSERLHSLYLYYEKEVNGNDVDDTSLPDDESISDFFCIVIGSKIIKNKIFPSIDAELDLIIRLFLRLQMVDKNTTEIRGEIIRQLGKTEIYRHLHIRISAGLAHSHEDRLRSVSSIFNAADGRAYLAKHNGRNGLFGLKNQRLS